MTKITYEFDLREDSEDLRQYQNIDKMYFALDEIYNAARSKLKYQDEPLTNELEQLLERIKKEAGIIHEF